MVAAEQNSPAVIEWTPDTERQIWKSLGWGEWMDWTTCSSTCGEGTQYRWRHCLWRQGCEGFNKQTRQCNMFSCQGAVSLLSNEQTQFLHGQWSHAPDRPTAWRLRPNAYLWLPAVDLPYPARPLRKQFALLLTLRLNPKEKVAGTLFSLRSRRQQNAYFSVELADKYSVKLVHAGVNGTQTVVIPTALADGRWHQLALGIQQDSSVRSYLDCQWVSTDILRRDSLEIPEDADVVIGYLFSGDMEQLVVVPEPGAVSQQCSGSHVSSLDPSLPDLAAMKHHRSRQRDTLQLKKQAEEWEDDEDFFEGSGGEKPPEQHEYVWSSWSKCSVSCGLGVQTRQVSCEGAGIWMEFCIESAQGKIQTRPCSAPPCSNFQNLKLSNLTKTESKDICECQNGGTCHPRRRSCHCPAGFEGLHCEIHSCPGPCLHGGVCHNSGYCSCPPEYTGQTCQTPVCRPPCMNGGQCIKPGVCSCPIGINHPRCASCPEGCEPGGACVLPGVCKCLPGFTGSLCQKSLCPKGCLNGGQCVAANQCNCYPGWTGSDCSTHSCKKGCLNGGVCVGPDLCECPVNATGPTCAEPLCDPPCENGAACAPGNTCLCAPHTSGARCQTKRCDYRFIQEPYTRGFRKLVKRRVESKCGISLKPCVRTVAEYQTVYKTFYRTVYKCAGNDTH